MYLKKPELQQFYPISLKRPVMSAEPSITIRKLKPEDSFLIFASDGLWETLRDEEAVNIVSRSPRAVSTPLTVHTERNCLFFKNTQYQLPMHIVSLAGSGKETDKGCTNRSS